MSDFLKRIISAISSFFLTIASFFGLAAKPDLPVNHGQWLLDVPAYEAGQYCETLYDTGTGLENEVLKEPQQTSSMQLVRSTTLQDADNYAARLQREGWRQTFENRLAGLVVRAYEKDAQRVYLCFDEKTGITRVIDDCCNTVPLDRFGYSQSVPQPPVTVPDTPTEPFESEPIDPQETQINEANAPAAMPLPAHSDVVTAPAETNVPPRDFRLQPGVYQYSLPYYDSAHSDAELYAKNGMLYVIVLSDGKLVIIDGGAPHQCANANIEAFIRFLREITGRGAGTRMQIAMWYGTHCHADHIDFFYKVIHKHYRELELERVMFNYQSHKVLPYANRVDKLRNLLVKYYPDLQYVKCRTGYAFSFLDARFEILYTHEQLISAEDAALPATNANDCCSVLKLTLGGKTFLFLGDSNQLVQQELLRCYDGQMLHADVLQAAHHMYNNLTELYPVIAPQYVMCPQSMSRTVDVYPSYATFRKLVPAQRMYFADQAIYGFLPQADGRISVSYRPPVGFAYDNSGL